MRNKSIYVGTTVVAFLSVFIIVVWLRLFPRPPECLFYIAPLIIAFSGIMLVLSLAQLISSKGDRGVSLLLVFFGLSILVAIKMIGPHGGSAAREWFVADGHRMYDSMVSNIVSNKQLLAATNRAMNRYVGTNYEYRIYGLTNADGSLTIRFFGRGNYSRAGYLFYSGNGMVAVMGSSNEYHFADDLKTVYTLITNDWYEFGP